MVYRELVACCEQAERKGRLRAGAASEGCAQPAGLATVAQPQRACPPVFPYPRPKERWGSARALSCSRLPLEPWEDSGGAKLIVTACS